MCFSCDYFRFQLSLYMGVWTNLKKVFLNKFLEDFMKYLFIILLSISVCFAEYEVINAEYKDTIDGYKINFFQRPFKVGDHVVFANFWQSPQASGPSPYIFIMENYKIRAFEGAKIIIKELEKNPNDFFSSINDVKIDSKNNLWMIATNGRFLKYDWNEFTVIDYIKDKYGKTINGNSLEIDENDNIYIHTNKINLIKYDGKDFVELEYDTTNYDNVPYSFGVQNLKLINTKIYFVNLNNKIGYYDLEQNKYEKLDLSSILPDNNYFIISFKKYDNKLFFTFLRNEKVYYYKYDNEKFENLDYISKLLPVDLKFNNHVIQYCENGYKYFNIQDSINYNTIYQIDTNNKVSIIDFSDNNKKYNNRMSIDGAYLQTNGSILLPDLEGGFLILQNPSSVETPLNVVFINNIYPNPAKTNVSIDFIVEPENLPNISVELYNLTGILQSKLVYNVDYNDSNGQASLNCNIENIANGYYIIVIDNGKRKEAKPFIVNKE